MVYKMCWELKEEKTRHSGPVLGNTESGVFIPLSFNQAMTRAKYFRNHYKRATYFLMEVPFLPSDRHELLRIHGLIDEFLEMTPDSSVGKWTPKFYTVQGQEAKLDYMPQVPDWDIESEEEDWEDEEYEEPRTWHDLFKRKK